jgi:aspartyl-tRNA(Asn)/glutamyl-tRNA(Gln) amidotransferase subunit A
MKKPRNSLSPQQKNTWVSKNMSKQIPWSPSTAAKRLSDLENRFSSATDDLRSVFTQTFFKEASDQIKTLNQRPNSPLKGALVSVKDLFDVIGKTTKAGTRFMASHAPAQTDAPAIKNLRDAGAIFVGHTNMTELAYSGLGLNPHYGTPENALVAGAIPGGSTSGGAVSVAQGAADIAIGTDTGGSLRIPAAFNGITGFKPTQRTVSRAGCKALSCSLDSVGPMAQSVEICAMAYQALSNGTHDNSKTVAPVFIIPTNYGMDDLDPQVHDAFKSAASRISEAGFTVEEKHIETFETLKSLAIWQFSSVESRGEYDDAFQTDRNSFDPRISSRMARADEVSAVAYRQTLNLRESLIEEYNQEIGNNILLMPTVPILPPSFEAMEDDDEYTRVNLQVLRNPSIANVMDCCSISLPYKHVNDTIGVMLTAVALHDLSLLELAQKCETLFEN